MGAVALGHAVEHPHHGLHGQLQLPRDHLEAGDRKQPQQQRRQQDHAHHYQRGYVRGVHVFQPKQTDAVGPVEHCVTHGLLHRLRLPVPGHQERTGQQGRRDQQPPHDEPCFLLFFHSLITFTYGPDFVPLRRFYGMSGTAAPYCIQFLNGIFTQWGAILTLRFYYNEKAGITQAFFRQDCPNISAFLPKKRPVSVKCPKKAGGLRQLQAPSGS